MSRPSLPLMLPLLIAASGCSASFDIGRPKPALVAPPAGSTAIVAPDGTEVIEPSAIETVITGLQQAQTVRTLTRQLAR
jgi:hypothetical protein